MARIEGVEKMADSMAIIGRIFGLEEGDAEALLMLTHWVDQEMAIRVHGYPKDNVIPAPLEERLNDREYVALLVEAAREDDEVGVAVRDALEGHLALL